MTENLFRDRPGRGGEWGPVGEGDSLSDARGLYVPMGMRRKAAEKRALAGDVFLQDRTVFLNNCTHSALKHHRRKPERYNQSNANSVSLPTHNLMYVICRRGDIIIIS